MGAHVVQKRMEKGKYVSRRQGKCRWECRCRCKYMCRGGRIPEVVIFFRKKKARTG